MLGTIVVGRTSNTRIVQARCALRRSWVGRVVGPPTFLLILVCLSGCQRASSPPAQSPMGEAVTATRQQAAKHFHIFRTRGRRLPREFVRGLPSIPSHPDWSLARALSKDAWIAPAQRQLCLAQGLVTKEIAVTCSGIEHVLAHGIFIASLAPPGMPTLGPRRVVIGLAPDGIESVLLITPGYRTVKVPVNHNVFIRQDALASSPASVRLVP
jgi:hypothetical protein